MQELLTPVTIGNEQYYPRKAVDAALQALNSALDAKTEENARMVARCSELRRAHDNLSRAHTDLESRYDDLYKACANWAHYVKDILFRDEHEAEKWSKMETRCRAKAEQYKKETDK